MATGRKTGGRTEGTPNKATSTLHELVEAEAGVPLPVLLTRIGIRAMKSGDHQLAVNALSRAAVYVYPRVATVDPEDSSRSTIPTLLAEDGVVKLPKDWPGLVIHINSPTYQTDELSTTAIP